MTSIVITIAVAVTISITITLNITGHINLNKIFNELCNLYITKKYNKKANDYNRLFPYFHSSLIRSPSGELVQYLLDKYDTIEYYPDYGKKKIFVLKNDINRKTKANKIYAINLKNHSSGGEGALALEENDKFCKADYYCHKGLSKDFKYFLELNELMETNYTFQKIIQAKWQAEASLNLEIMKKDKKI
jgi:hypothetical protein